MRNDLRNSRFKIQEAYVKSLKVKLDNETRTDFIISITDELNKHEEILEKMKEVAPELLL